MSVTVVTKTLKKDVIGPGKMVDRTAKSVSVTPELIPRQLKSVTVIGQFQNRLQWGRSNLGDPAEWPKVGLLNRDFGSILSVSPRKNSKTQSSLNFSESRPRKFTKSDFSGLAPIR